MQNKPNFLNNQMNITFCLTNYYEQNSPLRQSENKPNSNPIQTQSNPNKANLTPVFGPKIGFTHCKPATKERSCVCFLLIFTKKYTLLEKFLLSFCALFLFCAAILFKRLIDKKTLPIITRMGKVGLLFDDQLDSKTVKT
jgi:hypothetical protein